MAVEWFLPIFARQYHLFISSLFCYSIAVFRKGSVGILAQTPTLLKFLVVPTVPQGKFRELDHIRILPNAIQFIRPITIRRYVACDVVNTVK